MKSYICFILPITFFFTSACINSLIRNVSQNSRDTIEAQNLLSVFQNKNKTLKTFKGIGTIRLWNNDISQTIRVAWLGEEPAKLRIGIMSIAGQPAASVSSNGESLYFVSHAQQQFYKKEESDPTLKEFLSLPVKFGDIIALLCGRVPVREFHSMTLEKDASDEGYVLNLKTLWGNVIEKIYIDSAKTKVRKVEIFDLNRLVYRVNLDDIQDKDGFQLFSDMTFSDDAEQGFQFSIERYWFNMGIAPSKFVLSPLMKNQ